MGALIEHSFAHIDNLWDHIQDGCYDLIGPDNEIILPDYYEDVIQPGMTIKMLLWPLSKSNRSRTTSEADDSRHGHHDETPSELFFRPSRPFDRSYYSSSSSSSSSNDDYDDAANNSDDASTINGRPSLSFSDIIAAPPDPRLRRALSESTVDAPPYTYRKEDAIAISNNNLGRLIRGEPDRELESDFVLVSEEEEEDAGASPLPPAKKPAKKGKDKGRDKGKGTGKDKYRRERGVESGKKLRERELSPY